MKNIIIIYISMIFLPLCTVFGYDSSEIIQIAVASNFSVVMDEISKRFEQETGCDVRLIPGSTGKHYAQIKQGAPIDIFFSADVKRPEILEIEGIGLSDTRFTYAIGKIILWSPKNNYVDPKGNILHNDSIYRIAIANPNLAPYGRAAKETLENSDLWLKLKSKIVRGENIGQAFHFVNSGNADLGFVSASQIKHPRFSGKGSYWEVPSNLYSPIFQDAVLLKESKSGREFIKFVKSHKSKNIIQRFGYEVPVYE